MRLLLFLFGIHKCTVHIHLYSSNDCKTKQTTLTLALERLYGDIFSAKINFKDQTIKSEVGNFLSSNSLTDLRSISCYIEPHVFSTSFDTSLLKKPLIFEFLIGIEKFKRSILIDEKMDKGLLMSFDLFCPVTIVELIEETIKDLNKFEFTNEQASEIYWKLQTLKIGVSKNVNYQDLRTYLPFELTCWINEMGCETEILLNMKNEIKEICFLKPVFIKKPTQENLLKCEEPPVKRIMIYLFSIIISYTVFSQLLRTFY